MNKSYSPACDRNRDPILSVIRELFAGCKNILEIGSGTGQHAVYFARSIPHLTWYTSDVPVNHRDIRLWIKEEGLENVQAPLILDVSQDVWPEVKVDAVFSANTAHIMHWHEVQALFQGVGRLLTSGGLFVLYGPFNYNNSYTSESNAQFDVMLKQRDPGGGIRNFEDLDKLAGDSAMFIKGDFEMPANNRLLCWEKQ